MAFLQVNWQPTDRQLRQFGGICLAALPLLGWFWGGSLITIGVLASLGLVLATVGWVFPQALRPVFVALTLGALPLGILVGELTLLLLYFGLFLPLGLLFRLMRRDALQLRLDRSCASYWQAKKPPVSVASYFRQS